MPKTIWDILLKAGVESLKITLDNSSKKVETEKSGFHFFIKPYYISFSSVRAENFNVFQDGIKMLGYRIQYSMNNTGYYSGSIKKNFHSSAKVDAFKSSFPKGIASYKVEQRTK